MTRTIKSHSETSEGTTSLPILPDISIAFVGSLKNEFLMYRQMLSSAKYGCDYSLIHIPTLEKTEDFLQQKEIHLMMIDLSSNEDSSFNTFNRFHKNHPLIPKIVFTDFDDENTGLKAIRAGAEDYLVKEVISSYALNRSIQYAMERNQIEKSLWDSNRAMKDFASTAAHDLKSPLSVMISYLDLIQHQEQINREELDTLLRRVINSANRMNQLIDDLLRYAEVENRIMNLKKVNLNELFQHIQEDLNLSQQLVLSSLPTIDGDKTQLYQLFKNLIENALKFQKPESTPRIEVFKNPESENTNFVEIVIKDNGIGIKQKNLEMIFGAFKRVSSNYEGSGIGLSTCKRIVNNHKGKISVDSVFGESTTFTLLLPISQY